MKKLIMLGMVVSLVGVNQVNALDQESKPSKKVEFYCGAGLTQSFLNSKYSMDRKINRQIYSGATETHSEHKKSGIGKLGYELFVGAIIGSDWFIAPEFGVQLQHIKHRYDFPNKEDMEAAPFFTRGEEIVSRLNISYGNSYQFLLKLGKNFDSYKLYGIAGLETRLLKFDYALVHSSFVNKVSFNFKKRLYAPVLGIGGSKRINDHVSVALEYKYKPYKNVNYSKDWIRGTQMGILGQVRVIAGQEFRVDKSNRELKVKQSQHDISLRVVVNF